MRVLMVSDVYFPRVNGVSTSIDTFRRALAARGDEIRLVVPNYGTHGTTPGVEAEPGVVRVAGRAVPRDPEDRLVGWRAMHDAVREAARDCDLIHIQTPFVAHYAGLAAARALGKPVLATYHTLFEEYLHHYLPFLPMAWMKALARRFSRTQCNALNGVVVPSAAMETRLREYGVTVPLSILPTGIPLARFAHGERARFRATRGIAPDRPVALYVGRVAFEKNIDFLLDVAAAVKARQPDFLFIITGEGPALPSLKQRARALGLCGADDSPDDSVRFLGYLDRGRELPDCYAAADAFVFASRTETQGLVLLEAMAMGVPVVGLAAMGTVDILSPQRGAVVAPDAVPGFATALADLLADPGRRQALGEAAREYAREWADDVLAARLASLYQQHMTGFSHGKSL